jgi:hypothetical protein
VADLRRAFGKKRRPPIIRLTGRVVSAMTCGWRSRFYMRIVVDSGMLLGPGRTWVKYSLFIGAVIGIGSMTSGNGFSGLLRRSARGAQQRQPDSFKKG